MNSRLTVFLFLSLGDCWSLSSPQPDYPCETGNDAADGVATGTKAMILRREIFKAQSRVKQLLKSHVSLIELLSNGKMRSRRGGAAGYIDWLPSSLSLPLLHTKRPGTVLQGLVMSSSTPAPWGTGISGLLSPT